jgi:hypothetical protein
VSRDGSVGIAAGNDLVGRVSNPGRDKRFFSPPVFRPALGCTQPHIHWVSGAPSPGVKHMGREASHSPPSSAEVKNVEAIHPLPLKSSWHSA